VRRPLARKSLMGAVAVSLSVALSASVGVAAPERINKAPKLPTLPAPQPTDLGLEGTRSIPAAGSATDGMWITLSRGDAGNSRTRIKMPVLEGSPLMADWNGDGVATPGVFAGGSG